MSAECLAFNTVIERVGRSDYVGSFHSDEYARSATKHTERSRVLDYILSFKRPETDRIRLLSLPGKDWIFENMLLNVRPRSQIVGLEHSFSAYAQSRRAIPHGPSDMVISGQHLQDRTLPFGQGNIVYSRISANRANKHSCNRSNRSNRLLLMSAETYTSMMTTDYGATLEQRKEFYEKFYKRTAVWIDFTGTLTESVESVLRQLPLCLEKGSHPVVITVLNCRDRFRGAQDRVARMTEVQPAFQVCEHWTYTGKGGVSMLTVCGVMA